MFWRKRKRLSEWTRFTPSAISSVYFLIWQKDFGTQKRFTYYGAQSEKKRFFWRKKQLSDPSVTKAYISVVVGLCTRNEKKKRKMNRHKHAFMYAIQDNKQRWNSKIKLRKAQQWKKELLYTKLWTKKKVETVFG